MTLLSASCEKEPNSGGGDNGGGGNGGGGNGGGNTTITEKDPWSNLVNEKKETPNIDMEKGEMTYGTHKYTISGNFSFEAYNSNAKGKVTFTHIPSGFTEFKDVYDNFLSKFPHGVVAMVPMAMEIYARDHATGERCIKLLTLVLPK